VKIRKLFTFALFYESSIHPINYTRILRLPTGQVRRDFRAKQSLQ